MNSEEEIVFKKIENMKKEHELLTVIFEELDELINNNYMCSHCADETSGLLYSYWEYKKWKINKK